MSSDLTFKHLSHHTVSFSKKVEESGIRIANDMMIVSQPIPHPTGTVFLRVPLGALAKALNVRELSQSEGNQVLKTGAQKLFYQFQDPGSWDYFLENKLTYVVWWVSLFYGGAFAFILLYFLVIASLKSEQKCERRSLKQELARAQKEIQNVHARNKELTQAAALKSKSDAALLSLRHAYEERLSAQVECTTSLIAVARQALKRGASVDQVDQILEELQQTYKNAGVLHKQTPSCVTVSHVLAKVPPLIEGAVMALNAAGLTFMVYDFVEAYHRGGLEAAYHVLEQNIQLQISTMGLGRAGVAMGESLISMKSILSSLKAAEFGAPRIMANLERALGRPALAGETALAHAADGASDPVGQMIRTREAARIASENARHTPTPRTQASSSSSSSAAGSVEDDALAVWQKNRAPYSAAKPIHAMSNAELVQEPANRAERAIGGMGRIPGIHKHAYIKRLATRYQNMYGDRGFRFEVSYKGGRLREEGESLLGSVRLDVHDTTTGIIYDFKFVKEAGKGLRSQQVNKIRAQGPPGITAITEVNPIRQ